MMLEQAIQAESGYVDAEQRAAQYFQQLQKQMLDRTYLNTLMADFVEWKKNHVKSSRLVALISKHTRPSTKDYQNYIKWLDHTGRLEGYLDRSISYIFMRDLGKALDNPQTQDRINEVIQDMMERLRKPTEKRASILSMSWLYRKAQKDGIEDAMIWVMDKLKTVAQNIPDGMDSENAQRKLIKIIGGVVMNEIEEMSGVVHGEQRSRRLDSAIRLGYSYGLTYPFIDDLLDAKILSEDETRRYSDLIRTTLVTGTVPPLMGWKGKNLALIQYVHQELSEAFEFIKAYQRPETLASFFNQSYIFFNSQEVDRMKSLSNSRYTNEEIYIPVILKSSSSRLIIRNVISAQDDQGFDTRTFFYGIYNQLADDFADLFDDMEEGAVTPYTYYMKYHDTRPDLINPFELYWTVISNLIHNVYHSDLKTQEVILDRAINGLKRCRERLGIQRYQELMGFLTANISDFNQMVQRLVNKADNVEFFDKLLRDHMIENIKKENTDIDEFKATKENVRIKINDRLLIQRTITDDATGTKVVDAANYSLSADGKRLRPIVAYVMGVREYGLEENKLFPLLLSLEYLHTASLIYDDLPAQDNAPVRRGRPTLHQVYDTATAELTGLFLTQKAVEEQAKLKDFKREYILELIQYSSQMTAEMCKGQLMDLDSKQKKRTPVELEQLCFFKTGIAFEAALMLPAILAGVDQKQRAGLRRFARHAGVAFQIKDDILDVEGDVSVLGKQQGKDVENNTSTFVTVLGLEAARKQMWEHYCLAMDELADLQLKTSFLTHLLSYMINRDH